MSRHSNSGHSVDTRRDGQASPGGTSHAERVFRVQTAFAELGGLSHGPGELAKVTGLDDSAVHRILQSGVYQGTFVRVGRGQYQLGLAAAQLGLHALARGPEGDAGHAALQELRTATDGGLAFLYMLAPFGGAQRQCIDMAVGDSDLVELGMTPRDVLSVTRSLRTGASGRTILAYLPRSLQDRVIAERVPEEAGPGVYVDDDALIASLADVRDRGYALGQQECMAGWNSCAAPIMWDDSIMGAVLLLKPMQEMPVAPSEVVDATKTAAARLSRLASGPWPSSAVQYA
ncbi:IclR family transcriptional regulator C-terminal domain-containing protein [Streptantibioticus parmotrematis]|uniref:IclR family transcriptional regulator n=1 Tax=Streptantibioticus parmotrematis TaxID=2873249 RepID=UPI003400ABE8